MGRAGAAWAVVPRPGAGCGRAEGRGSGRPALRLRTRRGAGQGDRPIGGRRCRRRRGHGHRGLGAGRGLGPAGSGAGAPAEDGKAEDRDPAACQLLDHSSSVGCSCVSVLGGAGGGAAGLGRPGGRMPVVGRGTGGLATAGRPAPPASGDCTPRGRGGLARFRRIGEQHLEGLAPSAQHHPVRLDLLEAGIPHEVPYRVGEDPPPLHVFQVGPASSLREEHDPVEPRLRRRRGWRSGSGRGAGRLRRGLGPSRTEEVALGDDGEGRERRPGRGGRRRRSRLGRHRRRRLPPAAAGARAPQAS